MVTTSSQELCTALNSDLKKTGAPGLRDVVDDVVRKTFLARIDGAVLEFAHKQSDLAYWSGVKYYGSGSNSRVRIRRTAPVVTEAKTRAKRKPSAARSAAAVVAVPVS